MRNSRYLFPLLLATSRRWTLPRRMPRSSRRRFRRGRGRSPSRRRCCRFTCNLADPGFPVTSGRPATGRDGRLCGYYWVPGTWVVAAGVVGLLWTPGYWAWNDGGYAFTAGYWGPTVGFYGGIDYGFGYNGFGYWGGRWDHDRFEYNRAVNNFGNVQITNVYNQTVIHNNGQSRQLQRRRRRHCDAGRRRHRKHSGGNATIRRPRRRPPMSRQRAATPVAAGKP